MDRACDFDLVVFVTFPEHHASIMEKLAVLGCGGQRFAVVVHNPGGLDSLGERCASSVAPSPMPGIQGRKYAPPSSMHA